MAEDTTETTTTNTTTTAPAAKSIPYDRFQSVVNERNELKTTISDLQTQLQGALEKSATVDTLAATIEEMKTSHAAAAQDWATDEALLSAGLTDAEGRDIAKYLYGKIPPEGRPDLPAWMAGIKAEPATAPKALAPYLGPTAPAIAEPAAPNGSTLPPSNRGTNTTAQPVAGEPISAERIRQLRIEAMRTGDWSAYRESRGAILAAVKLPR